MPLFVIQPSFAAGELAPAMWARVDLAKYAVGARTMRNFFVHAHGGASNRPGTEYIASAKYNDKKCRLVPFQFSIEQAYVLEFGHQYIRFYMNGGQIMLNGSPYEVATPFTEDEIWQLKFTQSADVLYICHPKYPPKTLSRRGHTDWTLADFEYKDGPYLPMNATDTTIAASATTGTVTLTASESDDVFLPDHVGALWKLGHTVASQRCWGYPNAPAWVSGTAYKRNNVVKYDGKMYFCLSDVTSNTPPDQDSTHWEKCSDNDTMEIMVYSAWRLETSGYWRGSFTLERYDETTGTWKALRTFSGNEDKNYSVSGEVDEPVRMRLVSTTFTQINKDNTPQYQGYILLEGAMTYYEGWAQVTGYTDARHVTAVVKKAFGSTDATKDWAEGAWSKVRGYPSCVAFYPGDRLVFACSSYEPQTLWLSKVGDYNNFGTSVPVKDDDAITRTLASRQVSKILAIIPLNDLVVFTSTAEWKISASGQNAVLTPDKFNAQVQGYRGSAAVDPVIIGNRVIFVQEKGATVRDLGYDISVDGFTGADLSVLSRHLFQGHKIVDWDYQQEPDSIVWAVRDDGMLLGLTYLREHEVWAWHRHDTDGQFESVCAISGTDRNEIWFVVKRGDKRYVERLTERLPGADITKAFFVDCGLSYDGPAATVFSGLEHLEGREVAILADGNVLPRQTVTNGQIHIDYPASRVQVGLPYTCDLETLNIEYSLSDGTAQGREKKISEVTLRLENTRGGWVGPNPDKLDEIKMRATEAWGEPIALFTGDKKITLQGGYDKGGRVFIRQTDPLPITVLAVIPKVTHGG